MTYKAVIFDLDGTLVNSLEDLADATNYALNSFGQPSRDVKEFPQMVGDGTRTLISRALRPNKQELVEDVLGKMREKYPQICLNKTRPYKGLQELVAELVKRKIKLAVLTNEIIKGTTASVPVKPEPFEALQILKQLDVRPEETLFVGDSNIDVKTAKAAGIKAIGVSWGFRGRKELIEAGADAVIDEPSQLLSLFNK